MFHRILAILITVPFLTSSSSAQLYSISTLAGPTPLPNLVPAANVRIAPRGIARNKAGALYFSSQHCVYQVDSSGVLTHVAGTARGGFSGDGGFAIAAQLNQPEGLALDSAGNLYIADRGNYRIRKVSVEGIISTVAGSGFQGAIGDEGPAVSAQLDAPGTVAVDPSGNLYIGDENYTLSGSNQRPARVRKVSPDGVIHNVNTDRTLQGAAVAADAAGNLFITNTGFGQVLKVAADGTTTAVSGVSFDGQTVPYSLAVDSDGSLFVGSLPYSQAGSDAVVVKVMPDGTRTVVAGGGRLLVPSQIPITTALGVAPDGSGGVFIVDVDRVLHVSPNGVASTVAGGGSGSASLNLQSSSSSASQIAIDAGGIDAGGNVYVSEPVANRVLRISAAGDLSFVSGVGTNPGQLAVDGAGNLYVHDDGGIEKISPQGSVTNVWKSSATACCLIGMAADSAGNLYINPANTQGNTSTRSLVRIAPDGSSSTVAAEIDSQAQSFSLDAAGNLYYVNGTIVRKVAVDGTISTVAGNGGRGFSGDGGPATNTSLGPINYVASDPAGNLFISETDGRVRKVSLDGLITTIAGNGTSGYSGDGGAAISAQLGTPWAIAVGPQGDVFVLDINNDAIRRVHPANQPFLVSAVVDAASETPTPLSPGKIVAIYGAGFAPSGITVRFNGISAPLLYTTPTQIGAIVPYGIPAGVAAVTVSALGGTSLPLSVTVAASSPAVFTLNESGSGQAAAVNVDGTINTAVNPVKIGGYLSLYATGEGQTSPDGVDGKLATMPLPKPLLPVSVTVDGQPALIQYYGAAPGEIAGLMQVNIQVPPGIRPGGYVPVVIQVGAGRSQSGVSISVAAN